MTMRTFRRLVTSVGAALLVVGVAPSASADSCTRGPAGHPPGCPRVVPGRGGVVEGDTGSQVVEIPVTLSAPSPRKVTADWKTVFGPGVRPPDPAQPGADFQAASGTVTFEPGSTEATIAITVFGDDLAEGLEWIVVSFGNPKHAVMGGYWGLGFAVVDDDDPPLVASASGDAPATVDEGDSGSQILQLPVTLSQPSTQTVTVDWRTVPFDLEDPPTASQGVDYLAGSGTVTFPPGDTQETVSVTVLGDTTAEPDEWLLIELSDATNAVIGPIPLGPIGFGLVIDDD